MHKSRILSISCALALSLAGCTAAAPIDNSAEGNAPPPAQIITQEDAQFPAVVPIAVQAEDFVPTEQEMLSAREQALEGMTSEQIESLNMVIREANMWWEYGYLYDNVFGKLSDPNSLYWNYFDQTGEIQIGWAFDGELDMCVVCEQENLTDAEFYEKYGTRVVTNNAHDANDFIVTLDEIIADVQNEDLKADLQYVRDEARLAKETHSVEHANNEYKTLHDLDYFLLRYGPVDVGQYVKDDSTVSKYYGTLSIYS